MLGLKKGHLSYHSKGRADTRNFAEKTHHTEREGKEVPEKNSLLSKRSKETSGGKTGTRQTTLLVGEVLVEMPLNSKGPGGRMNRTLDPP